METGATAMAMAMKVALAMATAMTEEDLARQRAAEEETRGNPVAMSGGAPAVEGCSPPGGVGNRPACLMPSFAGGRPRRADRVAGRLLSRKEEQRKESGGQGKGHRRIRLTRRHRKTGKRTPEVGKTRRGRRGGVRGRCATIERGTRTGQAARTTNIPLGEATKGFAWTEGKRKGRTRNRRPRGGSGK